MRVLSCFLIVGLHILFSNVYSQVSIRDSAIKITLLHVSAKIQTPGADMANRFGMTPSLGFEVGHKRASNFYGQLGVFFLVGGTVKEDSVLDKLKTTGGFIINDTGLPTEVRMMQTGFMVPVSVGKVFSVSPNHNPNSGFFVELGAQFIQHKINFQPFDGPIAALSATNKKGYDRLTNGIGIREAIGYKYFSNSGNLNISIGFDFSQNFTQNRRSLNWDSGMKDTSNRLDLLSGFTVSWVWLIYQKAPPKFYFN